MTNPRRLRGIEEIRSPRWNLGGPKGTSHRRRGVSLAALVVTFLAGAGLVSAGPLVLKRLSIADHGASGSSTIANCNIKGNVSISGELIYHVPGQAYYDATRVDPLVGERWFCSEAEARSAGWRKARR